MEKVYGFSNENLCVFPKIYDFKNANVLSVLGSGDQYFTAMLNGAKNVDVFDVNSLTWYHFVLKFIGISVLSYEEFMQMFLIDGLDNLSIYEKLKPYLPFDVANFFDYLIFIDRQFSSIKLVNIIFSAAKNKNIPYFGKKAYYKLQRILRDSHLPQFINCNLLNLPDFIDKKYDVSLFSNIYHYLDINAGQYRDLLNDIDSTDIMALYSWILNDEEKSELLDAGFDVLSVPGVLNSRDYIANLTRKKQ